MGLLLMVRVRSEELAMGGERDVSVHGYGSANATSVDARPPATTPIVAANGGSGNGNIEKGGLVATCSRATPAPTAGFQSFPCVLVSRLQTLPIQNVQCPHGATTNTALLAQFLASQCRAFSTPGAAPPTRASCGDHDAYKVTNPVSTASPACNLQAQKENHPDPGVQANKLGSPNHPDGANTAKRFLSGATNRGNSEEKSPWSYSTIDANGGSGNGDTGKGGGGGLVASSNTRSPATPAPTGGFQSFPLVLLRRLQTLPNEDMQCPHRATNNIALLLQFLASQYPVFSTPGAAVPIPASCGDHNAPKVTNPVADAVDVPVSNASPACILQAEKENRPDSGVQANELGSPNHLDGENNATNHGNSKEKSPSSSKIVRNPLAQQSGDGEGVDNELLNGGSDLVFTLKRRSKMREVGTRDLKMSDLHTCFHLSSANAAKKLGVSLSTLKNACRDFGVKRWPGRKVRSLESTIRGLEHEIAIGQGTGLEESNEAYMRSEVCKLQQEMHQLVRGTPAQVTQIMHSPTVTADIYKRLYSRGWRSKHHSAGGHDTITLDTGNPTKKRAFGLAPPTTRKYRKATKENQQRKGP